jgi:hypothetical protein
MNLQAATRLVVVYACRDGVVLDLDGDRLTMASEEAREIAGLLLEAAGQSDTAMPPGLRHHGLGA